jgi:hypothetical protein
VKPAEKEAAKGAKGKGRRGQKPKNTALKAEEATVVKERCGRKRKKSAPEADVPEPKTKVARITQRLGQRGPEFRR